MSVKIMAARRLGDDEQGQFSAAPDMVQVSLKKGQAATAGVIASPD